MAFGSLNIASSGKLAEQINKAHLIIDTQRAQIDSLNEIVEKYESHRILFYTESTRIIADELYLEFNGFRHVYSINTLDSTIFEYRIIPKLKPDIFNIGNMQYSILFEEVFRTGVGDADSAIIYWDSLTIK